MEYPKPIMSLTELSLMGFSRTYLNQMAHMEGQRCCTRMSEKNKSKIIFDTARFEKERERMLVR